MSIKCVIFDLDGTILNTIDDLADSMNHTLSNYGLPTHSVDDILMMVGAGKKHFVKLALPEDKQDLADDVYRVSSEHYIKNCTNKTKPYDGIVELLDDLKKMGYKLAVLTNKDHDSAIITINHYFGYDMFDIVCGAVIGEPLKPEPAAMERVLSKLLIKNTDCVLIGDSDIDIQAAKNSNVKSIAVNWGYRSEQILKAHCPDYLVNSAEKIKKIIAEI